ncbi:putative Acid phosphatase [Helianthus annuus]|uniref:Acid phosphatase n=2 Tax=Helianthus annuus TaxID=4232 RepID=A0A251U0J3_HELAN|nr:putative Acid phosphatase [Helianthus annuus]KAJ0528179.1 putative Acid phosphatase [Helianthus annuus]KAJ0537061.1 putative Acid phosphatase [Helianthus annuus]KAJ0544615.1 putative Acid phosphatase [Helianthus annuus]KAJ0709622.1 putative Acid phosphatase [Helianthus annuus]
MTYLTTQKPHNVTTTLAIQNMGFLCLILVVTITTSLAFPINHQNYLVLPHSLQGSGACLSWRVGVEANNIRAWTQVPTKCVDYIGSYMTGSQYRQDCNLVCNEAYNYAKRLNLTNDGKDVWVFDVDDTILSNIPYFSAENNWQGVINTTSFAEWAEKGEAPAIPAALKLYKKLIKLGFKIVFLTGMYEQYTDIRIENLKATGYTEWEKLILRGDNDEASAVEYKSSIRKELEEGGYRIRGNMGDQWSDLVGTNTGDRTFKMPNPLYYVP